MASKDEYYKKIIASLQSEVDSIKSTLETISKRLEVLETNQATPVRRDGSNFNSSKFREEVKGWENEYLSRVRATVSEVCTTVLNNASPDFIIKPQFDKFQEEMKLKLIDIEKRITVSEKNAGDRISLISISRPTYVTERYTGPDQHPVPKPSWFCKYKKEIGLIIGVLIFTLSISLLATIIERDTLKRDNAALRHAIEQLYNSKHRHATTTSTTVESSSSSYGNALTATSEFLT